MQLQELSERAKTPTASIKFYLREGLLPVGETIHATRAQYSERHVERLELIQVLRRVVGLTIEQIRSLVRMADDRAPRLSLLAAVQRVVLKLDAPGTGSGEAGAAPSDAVVRLRRWPDYPSEARDALNAHLQLMDSLNIKVGEELLDIYSRAMDDVARFDIAVTAAPGSADRLILTAAVGMHMHSQLLLRLLALAQTSHSIRRFEPGAG
ncbi:Transcriptional regulator [Arthrobacter sp. 9AX]|uniref:MerR family transcriptional regulator n=1 Tax=Arthrobacter sp. 9AX TaxID=2653131 RepID=UPI0012EFE125|nr:MerR family transcriptional regulator [Arthrobacter sp. 9AX]VXB64729.1 Transcriptional regulator [Arthrobacter sp. 9AX]